MGRRRSREKSPARKKNEARQKKIWDEMTADKMEDMMSDRTGVGGMQLYGYGGTGGKFKNEAEAKKFMRDLRKKEAAAATQAATQSAVGDMVQQYTGQTLPPPPGQGASPKGQPQGGSPKGQPMQDNTGAAAGTYMNRVRNQRGAAGRPGFEQFAPTPMASPKGQPAGRGGSPKGQPPPRTGGPTPPTRAQKMYGSYERMPQRRRAYNPATGLIE